MSIQLNYLPRLPTCPATTAVIWQANPTPIMPALPTCWTTIQMGLTALSPAVNILWPPSRSQTLLGRIYFTKVSTGVLRKLHFFPPTIIAYLMQQRRRLSQKGVTHLVGNTVSSQASYRSQHEGEWPFGPNILSFLHGTTNAKSCWECVSFDSILGFCKKESCGTSVSPNKICCQWCSGARNNFFKLCQKEVSYQTTFTWSKVK